MTGRSFVGLSDIRQIRRLLAQGTPMARLELITAIDRDALVEAVWAIKREPDDSDALDHLMGVHAAQRQQTPLVNGHPQASVYRS